MRISDWSSDVCSSDLTPSRACTSWEQREHKAAALRKIAFLAISEAHQVFHWLPAALCLARDFGVEVSVLSPSRKMLDFIGSYDEKCVLELVQLRRPFPSRDSLFRLPSRLAEHGRAQCRERGCQYV